MVRAALLFYVIVVFLSNKKRTFILYRSAIRPIMLYNVGQLKSCTKKMIVVDMRTLRWMSGKH